MVTVYVWDHRYRYGSAGHASMSVSGGQPPGAIYISWWPEKHNLKTVTVGVRRGVHARLTDDELSTAEGRKPDHTIDLQALDESKIKAFWARWQQGKNYQLLQSSCTTTVGEALKEGGGDRYAVGWKSPTVWTPADVLHYSLAIQKGLGRQ